jgi:hypothetical protein
LGIKKIKIEVNNRKEVRKIKIKNYKITLLVVAVAVFVLGFLFYSINDVFAAALSGGSASLSDARPDQTSVSYTLDWDNVTQASTKCIQVIFSDAATGGSAPVGIGTTAAAVDAASDYITGVSGWTVNATTNGTVKITDVTGGTPSSSSDRTIVLTGITNGSTADTAYFVQFSTYDNTNCSSSGRDSGTVTFIYTSGQAVSLTVDPSISFSIAAVAIGQSVNGAAVNVLTTTTTIPFSTVTVSANAIAAHTLTVNTNAGSGYFVYIKYTDKPIYNVTNDINDHTGDHTTPTTMSAATEAFGYTTEDTDYSQFQTNKYSKFTITNAELAKSTAAVSNDQTKVGYEVGVAGNTPAGTYQTTVVLTCTPMY